MIAEQLLPLMHRYKQASLISYCSLDALNVFFKWLQEQTTPYSVATTTATIEGSVECIWAAAQKGSPYSL
jgi:hypothetical protein